MNKGTMVLVGCVVGAGVLFYTSSGSKAARPTETPTATVEAHETPELAHSGKTPPPSPSATVSPVGTLVPPRLTLAQVLALPRPPSRLPAATGPSGGGAAPAGPAAPTASPEPTTATPSVPATPVPATPPSENPTPPPTAPPTATTPTPIPTQWPWAIPTPPTLPPYPDGGLSPNPPSE